MSPISEDDLRRQLSGVSAPNFSSHLATNAMRTVARRRVATGGIFAVAAIAAVIAGWSLLPTTQKAVPQPATPSPSIIQPTVAPTTTTPTPVTPTTPPISLPFTFSSKGINDWALDKAVEREVFLPLKEHLGALQSGDSYCEITGDSHLGYAWKGITVEFDKSTKVLRHWHYSTKEGLPPNVTFAADVHATATLGELQAIDPTAQVASHWGNDASPWSIQVGDMTYLFETSDPPKASDRPDFIYSLNPNFCE